MDSDTGSDSDKMDANSLHEDSDDAPLSTIVHRCMKAEVGQYYVVQFQMEKQISTNKHYVGKILDVDNRKQECEITFARHTARKSLIFRWTAVVDK